MTPRLRFSSLATLSAVLALAVVPVASAQYFGRNKVVWERFDFDVLETEHFDLHSYLPEETRQDMARLAERWYERLGLVFDHEFEERKPLILYANHADFQQTLTTGGLIGESTGGFTEPLQDRVVLPLTGVHSETAHVIGHELVHAFQFDIADRLSRAQRQSQLMQLPLWLVEGLAEYLSEGRDDPQTAMWMRDAVIHDQLPDPEGGGRVRLSPYQYGQAFWAYVAGTWGDDAVRRLYVQAVARGPALAIEDVLGMSVEGFFERFHSELRAAYRPVIETRQAPADFAEPLLTHERTRGDVNIAPAISPDGRYIAFLSTRGLFEIELFLAEAETGRVVRKLLSASSAPHLDAISFLDAAGAWSPDGRQLAFTVFSEGDQSLGIFDVETGRLERRLELEGIEAMRHPSWSPDGRRLVFSATVERASDLFTYELETGRVERLTDDGFSDVQPVFSPSGDSIVFVTDRGPGTDLDRLEFGNLRLALLHLDDRRIDVLPLFEGAKHIDPHFSADGRYLYFVSDPDGVSDVYRVAVTGGAPERLTRVQTGVTGLTDLSPAIDVAANGDVLFSALEDGRWNIYALRSPRPVESAAGGERVAAVLPPPQNGRPSQVETYLASADEGLLPAESTFEERDYDAKLRLAYLGPPAIGIGADRFGLGFGGSFAAYWGDLLGKHQVGFAASGGSFGGGLDFQDSIGGQVAYLDQSRRFQWGAVGAHTPYLSAATSISRGPVEIDGETVIADVFDQVLRSVRVDEVALIGQYPFSINRRFEASVGATHYDFERELDRLIVVGDTVIDREISSLESLPSISTYQASLALVGDSSYFGFVSPLRGARWRIEIEQNTGDLEFQTGLVDLRKYFFARPVTFALRAYHFGRWGDEAEDERISPLFVGYNTLVRGYEIDDFDGSECTPIEGSSTCPEFDRMVGSKIGVVNAELRFPLFGTEDFGLFDVPWLPTELVAFVDGGVAWTEDESPELRFDRDTIERVPVFSAGVAVRMLLGGYIPLQVYWAFPFQRPEQDSTFGFLIAAGW